MTAGLELMAEWRLLSKHCFNMLKIRDIVAPLEEFAPAVSAEDYDNVGLLVGDPNTEIASALVCVDVTESVVDEAINHGAGLVIAHHPLIFRPLRSIGTASNADRAIVRAIQNNIAIYAAHTNLDRAPGGMSCKLAEILDIQNITPLEEGGFGVIGELENEADPLDFLRLAAARLGVGCVRHTEVPVRKVKKIALVTGSGGDSLERAIALGADVFLTGDVRHDRFLSAAGRILLADVGHFESEFCAIDLIHCVISKKIPNFALHKSTRGKCPVRYLVEH